MAALPLTPAKRDALTCAFALVLLTAPLWSITLDFDEQVHVYERAEVTGNGSTVEYAPRLENPPDDTPISDEIGCSGDFDTRVCAFESYLAANHSIPTGWQSDPEPSGYTSVPGLDRYEYVRVDDQIYEATYTTGDPHASRNASTDGLTRIYLAQDPVSPWEALAEISVAAEDVSPAIRRAARTGSATHSGPVEVPETPVKADGNYYRVYEASVRGQSVLAGFFGGLLRFFAPVVGFGLLVGLRGQFELRHVSQIDEKPENGANSVRRD